MNQHVLSIKVENKTGVVARVVGLFSARGYNIDSITASRQDMKDESVITIVVPGDDKIIEQVKKQLNKLIDVIKVTDHTDHNAVQRKVCIIKIKPSLEKRIEIFQIVQAFKAEIIDISQKNIILEAYGDPNKINNFIETLRPYGIQELVTSGRISFMKE
jgi:acetolactate synthase I/III small subunit